MNLLFAIVVFVVLFSIIGFDVQLQSGEVTHMMVDPGRAIVAGFTYIGMVAQAVAGLFNPATAAQTVSDSSSVVGIAVMSKQFADAGLAPFMEFMAMISVSLGIMNLLPIPPLDGGRFVIEVFQKLSKKVVSLRAMNAMSMAGMALFVVFLLVMVNQGATHHLGHVLRAISRRAAFVGPRHPFRAFRRRPCLNGKAAFVHVFWPNSRVLQPIRLLLLYVSATLSRW